MNSTTNVIAQCFWKPRHSGPVRDDISPITLYKCSRTTNVALPL
jgi:hypothetical protein